MGANEPAIEARKTHRVENEEHPWLARHWVWVQNQKKVMQLHPFLSIKGQDTLDFVVYCVFALGGMMSLPQQYSGYIYRYTYRYTYVHCCAAVDHQIKLSNTTHCWQKHFESRRVDFSFH